MLSSAYLKNLHIAPKKLRFFLPEIKKRGPLNSLDYLFYNPNKAAKILYKAIKSAINNAKNTLKTSDNLLKFKVLLIEEGQKLKRYRPGGRGMVKPIRRRMAHIKIVLESPGIKNLDRKTKGLKSKKPNIKVKKTYGTKS